MNTENKTIKKIYIYETPRSKNDGYIKIGETTRDNVEDRIKEQFSSAALYDNEEMMYTILHERLAVKKDGTEYTDKDFHRFLDSVDVKKPSKNKEWFELTLEQAIYALESFESGDESFRDVRRINSFPMRKEQSVAVELAYKYFDKNKNSTDANDFLWNAKMRFGKTFSAYQLMKKSNWKNTLVITYRPAVKKSWRDDLNTHKDFSDYVFLSDGDIVNYNPDNKNVVFMSFQDLLGSKTNIKDKHDIVFSIDWDCVIIDEFHYGSSTENARGVFEGYNDEEKETLNDSFDKNELREIENEIRDESIAIEDTLPSIKTKNRIFLSGTPFKAIGNNRFSSEQIFNWTYLDEQRERSNWVSDNPDADIESNPYYSLPPLNMFIYEMSNANYEIAKSKDRMEFSLSQFFRAKGDKFENEGDVKMWLDIICGRGTSFLQGEDQFDYNKKSNSNQFKSKFPYANKEDGGFAQEIKHTFWLMPSVASCKAMAKLLEEHNLFSSYKAIVAAGTKFGVGANAIPPVEQAISTNEKTITLSCGKLTEGVSIKEWTAILFLTDVASPERYFQTAFRAQTPWRVNGKTFKKNCYVFDFHPSRSLKLLSEYSSKLNADENKKGLNKIEHDKENLTEFIKYLPVLRISGNYMAELNASEVHSYDITNYNSSDLTRAFQSYKNFDVSIDTINGIMTDISMLEKCDSILDNIKAYRKSANISESGNDVSVKELGDKTKKIEDLKTKDLKQGDAKEKSKVNSEIKKEEKELRVRQDRMRELLKVLLGRIPLFIYLTHAQEKDLREVLRNTQSGDEYGLFRKATGIETDGFEFLMEIGLIKADSIDGYVRRFHELEMENYKSDSLLFNN